MAEHPADFRSQGEPGTPGHEPTDIGIRHILVAAVVLVTLCIGTFFLIRWIMIDFRYRERSIEASRPPLFRDNRGLFPEPRLQENPHADLVEMRKANQQTLTSYGWIDRKAGIARIPIDRAIEIMANKESGQQKSSTKQVKPPPSSLDSKPTTKPGGGQ